MSRPTQKRITIRLADEALRGLDAAIERVRQIVSANLHKPPAREEVREKELARSA